MNPTELKDPFKLAAALWPHVEFYDKQQDIIRSVERDRETYVVAGNVLGKDFVAGFILVWFFLTRTPCRVVTTSVDHTQLEGVLWGEVRRFIQTSAVPLSSDRGGPLVVNHMMLRKLVRGEVCPLSYAIGRVAAKGEGMLGHHVPDTGDGVPRTLFMADEASGVDDESERRADTWKRRALVIGNPYECDNFFKRGVEAGDSRAPDGTYYRRVIRVRAEDSPNVRWGLAQRRAGIEPDGRTVLQGVLSWDEYCKRRALWPEDRQCIGLDAEFWRGGDVLMFPKEAMALAAKIARERGAPGRALGCGCDPGEGSAETALYAVDEEGVVGEEACKEGDVTVIADRCVAFMLRYGAPPADFVLDVGGGGRQVADLLRSRGYPVRTVAFGGSVAPEPKRGLRTLKERVAAMERAGAYRNRRAQLYGDLSELVVGGFGIPERMVELRRQLALIPRTRDREGRLELLPKSRRTAGARDTQRTLVDIIGCSPDRADALALAVHAMLYKSAQATAGVVR